MTFKHTFLTNPDLITRTLVGYDSMLENLERIACGINNYPPCNIARINVDGADTYQITIAVAGFKPDEISVTEHNQVLTVSAKSTREHSNVTSWLHRGLAARDFSRQFRLAEHTEITEASLEDGILTLTLVKNVPESQKPRVIPVAVGSKKVA